MLACLFYSILIRSVQEYDSVVWSIILLGENRLLESFQNRFSEFVGYTLKINHSSHVYESVTEISNIRFIYPLKGN